MHVSYQHNCGGRFPTEDIYYMYHCYYFIPEVAMRVYHVPLIIHHIYYIHYIY